MIITITLIELTFTDVWQSMKQKQGQCAPVSPMGILIILADITGVTRLCV